jgi:hypothetical protein
VSAAGTSATRAEHQRRDGGVEGGRSERQLLGDGIDDPHRDGRVGGGSHRQLPQVRLGLDPRSPP